MLNALRRDRLLTPAAAGWQWDNAAVRAHLGRSDVAGLLAARPAALPEQSRATATLVAVHTARHAAVYGLGRLEEADEEYQAIERLGTTVMQRADATAVQVLSLTHRTRFAEAIGLGIGSLRELGIAVPVAGRLTADLDRQFGYLHRWLDHTDDAGELARPGITAPTLIAVARLINALLPASYVADHATLAWLSLEGLRIWLEHGPGAALVGPVSHTAFVAVTLRGDYAAGNRAMRRILDFGAAHGYEPGTSQARFLYAVLACWSGPLENGVEAGRRAREGLLAGGDLAYAGYTYLPTVYYQLDSAPSLGACVAEVEAGLVFVRRTGNEEVSGWLDCCRWLTGVLRGEGLPAARRLLSAGTRAARWGGFTGTSPPPSRPPSSAIRLAWCGTPRRRRRCFRRPWAFTPAPWPAFCAAWPWLGRPAPSMAASGPACWPSWTR